MSFHNNGHDGKHLASASIQLEALAAHSTKHPNNAFVIFPYLESNVTRITLRIQPPPTPITTTQKALPADRTSAACSSLSPPTTSPPSLATAVTLF